jgi:hypothetical protein
MVLLGNIFFMNLKAQNSAFFDGMYSNLNWATEAIIPLQFGFSIRTCARNEPFHCRFIHPEYLTEEGLTDCWR